MVEKKKLTKEGGFEEEINALELIGLSNVKGKNECIIYFKRFIYGKWINGWARYIGNPGTLKTLDIKQFMIDKGQIGY